MRRANVRHRIEGRPAEARLGLETAVLPLARDSLITRLASFGLALYGSGTYEGVLHGAYIHVGAAYRWGHALSGNSVFAHPG